MLDQYVSQTQRWKKTRSLQIVIVRTTLMTIILLTASLATILFWPIRNNFRRRDLGEFQARSELVRFNISGFFDHAEQLARQIPSRSKMREELVDYLNGELTLEAYRASAGPRLEDAVIASTTIAGACRFDPEMKLLLHVGIPADKVPDLYYNPEEAVLLPETMDLNGETAALYLLPIVQEDLGIVGYDLIAVWLSPIIGWMNSEKNAAGKASILLYDGTPGELPVASSHMSSEDMVRFTKTQSDSQFRDGAGKLGSFITTVYTLTGSWHLIIAQNSHDLYRNARREILIAGFVVLTLGVLASIITGIVLSVFSRRTIDETKSLELIIEEQTEELRVLLKEVIHRIKNDIYLTNTLIELKAAESTSDEAKEVLEEAASSLRMMGELYTLLHENDGEKNIDIGILVDKIVKRLSANASTENVSIKTESEKIIVPYKLIRPIIIVVNELVTNSLKYGVDQDDSEVLITIRMRSPRELEIIVTDNGPGYPEEMLEGVSGFGLEMVRSMVNRAEGTIELSNTLGARTVVVLKIPPED